MRHTPALVAIGIDVGGTQTRVALVDQAARVHARRSRPTKEISALHPLVDWLADSAAELGREAESAAGTARGVGIALPGTLDRDRRTVVRSLNLPFLEGRSFVDTLATRLDRPPVLLTDAEAASWGEYMVYEPKPGRFVHLRLGTGIACGVVTDGVLHRLDAGRRRHLDLLVVDTGPQVRPCRCGRRGCLETIASGPALEQVALALFGVAGLSKLEEAWRQGDSAVTQWLEQVADAVAAAVGNLTKRFGTGVVCLGGGVFEQLPSLRALTAARLAGSNDVGLADRPVLEPDRLGDDAGVVGAGLWAIRHSVERDPTTRRFRSNA
jgi:predicted NBD/HSP70 family sugar kinase